MCSRCCTRALGIGHGWVVMATNSLLRFWWAAGAFPLLLAGLLLPDGQFLRANSQGSDDWEIELVPRSAGPTPQLAPSRTVVASRTAAADRQTADDLQTDPEATVPAGPLTPAQKGWAAVESTVPSAERAVPLNAARSGAVPLAAAVKHPAQGAKHPAERAQPLNAVVASGTGSATTAGAAVRNVSTSRSTSSRRTPAADAEVPNARLMPPKFAQRETVTAADQTAVAVPAGGTSEHAAVVAGTQAATSQQRTSPSAGPSSPRSLRSVRTERGMAGDSPRPIAGELPAAVAADERAEPLNADSSRSVASAAARRRSQRPQKSIEIADSDAATEQEAAPPSTHVIAPDPQRPNGNRQLASASLDSIPLAGHSLFVDPLPLAPTFTGKSPAYPAAAGTGNASSRMPDSRSSWNPANPQGHPYVVPRHAIPHTGWYGPPPGVRSISHSVTEPGFMPGHSLRDR